MPYFSYINNSYSLKNKLEKDVYAFIQTKNRLIIDNDKLEVFCVEIIDGIKKLNETNKRCKPIDAGFWSPSRYDYETDHFLHMGGGICNFSIYCTQDLIVQKDEECDATEVK